MNAGRYGRKAENVNLMLGWRSTYSVVLPCVVVLPDYLASLGALVGYSCLGLCYVKVPPIFKSMSHLGSRQSCEMCASFLQNYVVRAHFI